MEESIREVQIVVSSTSIRLKACPGGDICHFPNVNIFALLKAMLTEYDYDHRRKRSFVKYKYFSYDRKTDTVYIPVNMLTKVTEYIKSYGATYTIVDKPLIEPATIDLQMDPAFQDREHQADIIEFLTNPVPGMRALDLNTGGGKTYCAIKSIVKLGMKAIIIVPANLMGMWHDRINDYCLGDVKLKVIKGSKSVIDLFTAGDENDSDIYLASVNTLVQYATEYKHYDGLPSIEEFFEMLQIGVKVIDECHQNFFGNLMIDLKCQAMYNLYLSATYMRSAKSSNAIFLRVYPAIIRYGGVVYDKYISITECEYKTGYVNDKLVSTPRGYSHFKYEKYLMKHGNLLHKVMDGVMLPVIKQYYMDVRKDGQKLLILVGLRDFAETVMDWIHQQYPSIVTNTYLYEDDDDVLEEADVIVSTIGSCGTGKDIAGLRSLILFVSFASETLSYQTIGRLRKMEDTPEFVYLYNASVKPHVRHRDTRRVIYSGLAKEYKRIMF